MKKSKWLILSFILILSIGFFSGRYSLKKEHALNVANLRAARDSIQTYSVKIKSLEIFVSLKEAIIEDQKDAIKAGLIERDRLKALHLKEIATNTRLSARINILRDSLKIVPGTIIVTIKDTSGNYADYIKLPFQLLKESDRYLKLDAGMKITRTPWFDLSVPFSGELTLGWQRSGLKLKPVGIFTSENPYLKIESMDALIIKENKKWYQKTWFHVFTGAAGMVLIYNFVK